MGGGGRSESHEIGRSLVGCTHRADHFVFSGLDSDALYHARLLASPVHLALLRLDESGHVLDVSADEFPLLLIDLRPNQMGELRLAMCALEEGGVQPRDFNCDAGTTATDAYELQVEYVPEPGAHALQLAALPGLSVLSRRRT